MRSFIAVCFVLGWLLRDVLQYALVGHADLALRFAPDAAWVAAIAAAVCFAKWPGRAVLLAAAVVAATPMLRQRFWFLETTSSFPGGPEVVLAIALAPVLLQPFLHRPGIAAAGAGVGFGMLCGSALALARVGAESVHLASFAFGLLLVLAALLLAPGRREKAVAVMAAIAAIAAVPIARTEAPLRRPDRLAVASMAATAVPASNTAEPPPNLLLITLDTVRCDHFPRSGGDRVTAPETLRLAQRHATTYTRATSTSPWTLPSHASLLTGLYPGAHGATLPRASGDGYSIHDPLRWPAQPLRSDVATLGERLLANGYRTAAVVSNGYLAHDFGVGRGFEHYDDRESAHFPQFTTLAQLLNLHLEIGWKGYRDAETVTTLALEWLEARPDADTAPFFLFLNYMDAHSPYAAPSPWAERFADEVPPDLWLQDPVGWSRLSYDREIAYLDSELGRLYRALESSGVFEETVIVVTSDHGEAFGEHDGSGHARSLFEDQTCVPLIVKPAGTRGAAFDSSPTDSTQVHAIALAELSLGERPASDREAISEFYAFGNRERSARDMPVGAAEDLISWRNARNEKWIVGSTSGARRYDLERDPRESENAVANEAAGHAAAQRALDWWKRNPPPDQRPASEPDPKLMDRLRALGYGVD